MGHKRKLACPYFSFHIQPHPIDALEYRTLMMEVIGTIIFGKFSFKLYLAVIALL